MIVVSSFKIIHLFVRVMGASWKSVAQNCAAQLITLAGHIKKFLLHKPQICQDVVPRHNKFCATQNFQLVLFNRMLYEDWGFSENRTTACNSCNIAPRARRIKHIFYVYDFSEPMLNKNTTICAVTCLNMCNVLSGAAHWEPSESLLTKFVLHKLSRSLWMLHNSLSEPWFARHKRRIFADVAHVRANFEGRKFVTHSILGTPTVGKEVHHGTRELYIAL